MATPMSVVSNIVSVAAGGFLAIQPPATEEWIIHNIYFEGPVELYFYDGTNSIKFDTFTSGGVDRAETYHVTNTRYIRVKNTDTISRLIGYDGVVTKGA